MEIFVVQFTFCAISLKCIIGKENIKITHNQMTLSINRVYYSYYHIATIINDMRFTVNSFLCLLHYHTALRWGNSKIKRDITHRGSRQQKVLATLFILK